MVTQVFANWVRALILLGITLALSCSNNSAASNGVEEGTETPQKENSSEIVKEFSQIPAEIEGCSCLFSRGQKDLKNGKHILAIDFKGNAFLYVNDSLLHFIGEPRVPSEGNDRMEFRNADYLLKVDLRQSSKTVDEVWEVEGKVMLISENRIQKVSIPLKGTCGC